MTTITPLAQRRGPRRALASLAAALAAGVSLLGLPAGNAAAATAPLAPSNLSYAYSGGLTIATLVWADNSTDETGFEVERCTLLDATTCGPFDRVASIGANQTGWTDTLRGSFHYRVRAVNAVGASGFTAEVGPPNGGTPSAVIAPIAPATATLPVTFDGSPSIAFDLSAIVGWEWSFGDGATAHGAIATHAYANAGTYNVMLTVTDRRGGTGYARATVTVASLPLVAPTLTATSTVKRRVDLTWTLNTPGNTALHLLRCTGATCTSWTTLATLPVTTTSYRDSSVRSGTTYRYLLIAVYLSGTAEATAKVKAR